ncbi:MAG: glycosyltransferase family 2 protein, partial [Deltaproteobacteria bacterium]|nr:glycosyltransferase family 2 protein [Deltaproteobacteria bacterium]
MNYLALCCIVKDEGPFLSEWFIWHALAGVEHFYVYDNKSAVPVKNNPVVSALLKAGRATLHEIEGEHRQYAAYDHCFKTYGAENFWIGALDLDEFVYLARPDGREKDWLDFRPFLAEFEDQAGLGLSWSTMGSAGHLKRPPGLVTAVYREKLLGEGNSNHHIKTFLRASCFAGICGNPHNFAVKPGAGVVNEKHHPIPPGRPFFPPFNERAWIYHYFFKSQQDFEIKTARGRADVPMSDAAAARRYATFGQQADTPVCPDSRTAALAPLVEAWLRQGGLPPLLPEPDPAQGLEGFLELSNAVTTLSLADRNRKPASPGQPAWAEHFQAGELSVPERFNRAEAVL